MPNLVMIDDAVLIRRTGEVHHAPRVIDLLLAVQGAIR